MEPLLRSSVVALLHHFGKLTESQKERDPGERMAGSGAMYGAMDIGFLITRSEDGARRLRIEVEARDFAAPDPIGVVIVGNGSGENGGFTYTDTATFALDATAAEERDLVAEVEALFADGSGGRFLRSSPSRRSGGRAAALSQASARTRTRCRPRWSHPASSVWRTDRGWVGARWRSRGEPCRWRRL